MIHTEYHDPRVAALAERQIRHWAQLQETTTGGAGRPERDRPATQAICYVTISREAGAAGTTVAQLVGEQLAWKVYDSNLLDLVAQRYHESRMTLKSVDETRSNWVYDTLLGTLLERHVVSHEKYAIQVSHTIQMLARSGAAVFVGRGAQFLLPSSKTFAVRIVAPESFRAQRVRQRLHIGLREALDWIHRTDRGRREFTQRFFRRDINDPHLYDMVINVERIAPAGAAQQIVHAVRRAAGQSAI